MLKDAKDDKKGTQHPTPPAFPAPTIPIALRPAMRMRINCPFAVSLLATVCFLRRRIYRPFPHFAATSPSPPRLPSSHARKYPFSPAHFFARGSTRRPCLLFALFCVYLSLCTANMPPGAPTPHRRHHSTTKSIYLLTLPKPGRATTHTKSRTPRTEVSNQRPLGIIRGTDIHKTRRRSCTPRQEWWSPVRAVYSLGRHLHYAFSARPAL